MKNKDAGKGIIITNLQEDSTNQNRGLEINKKNIIFYIYQPTRNLFIPSYSSF